MQYANFNFNIPAGMRRIDTLVLHCSATPEGRDVTVEQIRKMHLKNGWVDIGYHYVIHLDGSIHLGRPLNQIGAHAAGHNTGSIGICYIGGMDKDNKKAMDTRTPAQQAALLELVQQHIRAFGPLKIYGHNQLSNKSCPCFDVPSWVQSSHLLDSVTLSYPQKSSNPVQSKWYESVFETIKGIFTNKPQKPKPATEDTNRESLPRSIPHPDKPIPLPVEENVEELDAPENPGWLDTLED